MKKILLRALAEMLRLWDVTIASLHRVDVPILVFRSRHDHVVDPSSVRLLTDLVGSTDVDQRELLLSFHVATLDYDAPTIFAESAAFIRRVTEPDHSQHDSQHDSQDSSEVDGQSVVGDPTEHRS